MENCDTKNLDYLIKKEGWSLGVCGFRFGGLFAFLVPDSDIFNEFENQLQGPAGDITNVEFQCYILEEGSWLPVAYSDSYETVIDELSKKILIEKDLTQWLKKTEEAYKVLVEMITEPDALTEALRNKDKKLFFNLID